MDRDTLQMTAMSFILVLVGALAAVGGSRWFHQPSAAQVRGRASQCILLCGQENTRAVTTVGEVAWCSCSNGVGSFVD